MKKLSLLFGVLLLVVFISCTKEEEPILTISQTSILAPTEGNNTTITLIANNPWIVSGTDWCTVTPSSGIGEKQPVTIIVKENNTYDTRNCTLTFSSAGLSQSLSITQESNYGIVLPKNTYELSNAAQQISVEVKANVNYDVTIDTDWIHMSGTKALTSKTYNFSIEENTNYDSREGKITIKGQGITEIIKVKQAQKDAIIISSKEYKLAGNAQSIEINLQTNIDTEVVIPELVNNWISHVQTKGLSNKTIILRVEENNSYDKREGEVYVKNKTTSLQESITIRQEANLHHVTGVSLSKTSLEIIEGESVRLYSTIKPEYATNKKVSWSSSNPSIASVSDGNVKALREGFCIITVTTDDQAKTAQCEVNVKSNYIPVTGITLDKTYLSMTQYDTETLQVTVYPSDATNHKVSWYSDNPSVAKVDSQGKVTAVSSGTATITVESEDSSLSAVCVVTVEADSYEAVDLGLSVKWAAFNYNAASPYEVGGYYLWGDPTGTATIGYNFNGPNMDAIGGTSYDIIRNKWGGKWRLPTMAEFRELYSKCTWQYTTLNGIEGMKVIGPNGKSIFLPMTGLAFPTSGAAGSFAITDSSSGYYMTSESYKDSYGRFAYLCQISPNASYSLPSYRVGFVGIPIRAVR